MNERERESWKRLKEQLQAEEEELRMYRQYTDLIDEAVREFERGGGLEHVKGKGKPLQLATGNPLYGVLKTAGVKPPWLQLQHDIRDALRELLKEVRLGTAVRAEERLQDINRTISRYNRIVPHYTMQRAPVRLAELDEQLKTWE